MERGRQGRQTTTTREAIAAYRPQAEAACRLEEAQLMHLFRMLREPALRRTAISSVEMLVNKQHRLAAAQEALRS